MVKKLSLKNLLTDNKWLILLFFISLIPLLDLFHPGLFTAHDSPDHVARISNFYQNLKEGNIIPRWAANLNWGYGHPILMFLYPFPSYLASFFHFIGFSLVDSTKLVFILGFVLSGTAMYLWIKELWGEKAGFISGILYMFAPYRFVDLYVRGAIGENFFFIWPPLICYFLVKLSKNKDSKYIIGVSLSTAFMVLSHNALSLMFLPFILGYSLLLLSCQKKKISLFFIFIFSIFLGFSLSSFFWLPAFFEGKYTLRNIVIKGEWANRFETIKRLIYSSWNYGGTGQFSVQLGIVQWAMIITAPVLIYFLWKQKRKLEARLLIFSYFIFWTAIILILPVSKIIYEKITIFQKFQFPWRWLSLAIFPPAIFGGLLIFFTSKRLRLILVFCFLFFVLYFNKDYWQVKSFSYKLESFYSKIYHGTTDTGESAPVWSVRFMEKEPKAFIEVVEGKAEINTKSRKTTKHLYKVNVKTDKARLVDNTLYFPGWFVYVDNKKKPLYDVWFQDPNYRGLINFFVKKGEHFIEIRFEETRLRKIADIITAASLFGVLFIIYLPKLKARK